MARIDPDDYYTRGAQGLAEQIRWQISVARSAAPDEPKRPVFCGGGQERRPVTWADVELVSVTPVKDVGVFVFFRVRGQPVPVYMYFADYTILADLEYSPGDASPRQADGALLVSDVMDDFLQFQMHDFLSEEIVHELRVCEFVRLDPLGEPPRRFRESRHPDFEMRERGEGPPPGA